MQKHLILIMIIALFSTLSFAGTSTLCEQHVGAENLSSQAMALSGLVKQEMSYLPSPLSSSLEQFVKDHEKDLTREAFYKKLACLITQSSSLEHYLAKRYDHHHLGDQMAIKTTQLLGHDYLELMVDPGVAFHFNEFLERALKLKKQDECYFKSLSPWQLRKVIEKEMGYTEFIHMKKLSKSSLGKIKCETGLYSPLLFNISGNRRKMKSPKIEESMREPIQHHYLKKVSPRVKYNTLISLSKSKDHGVFAVYDPEEDEGEFDTQDDAVIELTVRVPILSTFSAIENPDFITDSASYTGDVKKANRIKYNKKRDMDSGELETFLPVILEKEEIIGSRELDKKELHERFERELESIMKRYN